MTQSEASANFMGSSFPYGGQNTGLPKKREEERERARRRRAQQLPKAEADSQPLPLFQPRKVQAISDDPLQHSVQAALGDFDIISKSMHQRQYLLLGIGQVPQTPVEGSALQKEFKFDGKPTDKNISNNTSLFAKLSASNSTKTEKTSSKTQRTSQNAKTHGSNDEKSKSEQKNSVTHQSKQSPVNKKSTTTVDQSKKSPSSRQSSHDIRQSSGLSKDSSGTKEPSLAKEMTSTKEQPSAKDNKESALVKESSVKEKASPKKSASVKESSTTSMKEQASTKEQLPVKEQAAAKEPGAAKENDFTDVSSVLSKLREKLHKAEEKEASPKTKPPKLSFGKGNSMVTANEDKLIGSESSSVEKILEEMTQPIPPLTGIQTPLKGNSRFAFPLLPISQKDSPSVIAANLFTKKKEESNDLLDELSISDDSDDEQGTHHKPSKPRLSHRKSMSSSSGSSSEDSDSDSSDSESDSSDDEQHSPVNSPTTKAPPSGAKIQKNGARTWGLGDLQKAFTTDDTKEPPTTASGPEQSALSLNTVGGEGLRGNQAAPAANSKTFLNTTIENELHDKDLPEPLFDDDLSLFDGLPDLTDLSTSILENHDESGLDILSNDISNDLIKPEPLNNTTNTVNNSRNSPKAAEKEHTSNGLTKALKHPKKETKNNSHSSKKTSDSDKAPKEKKSKEKEEKSLKAAVKNKQAAETAKSRMADKEVLNSSASSEKSASKKKEPSEKHNREKKWTKVRDDTGKSTVVAMTTPKPVSDGENEVIDVVTVSYDRPSLHRSNSMSSEKELHKESHKNSKSKHANHKVPSKGMNGVKEHVNGRIPSPERSPVDGLTNGEIMVDDQGNPDSLVVKIDLALLKRVPRLPGTDSIVIKLKNAGSPFPEVNGGCDSWSPPRGKIPKRHLSIELSDAKKSRVEPTPDANDTKKTVKTHERKDAHSRSRTDERRTSTSSNGERDDNRRKRSPSRESDRHSGKRRRHEGHRDQSKYRDHEHENGWDRTNGWDKTQDLHNGVSHKCSCSDKKETEKQDAWIERLYQPEPKVSHGPDHYLKEAKRVKHHADAIKDTTARAHKYFEAVLYFVRCGKALEQNNNSESKSAYQMYVETVEMLKYAMRLSMNKSSGRSGDKRFLALCMRLQSLLYMRLFRLRKDGMVKSSKMLMEHFKGPPKCSQAPSPYNNSNSKMTGTPSPMSPTPSPSGSIGSVGSVGSTGSNEAMTTPSRSNKIPSAMTSPVNVSIPQKIHTMTVQHLGFTSHMLYAYDVWEQSQAIFIDNKDFFMDLDRTYGPVTLHSPVLHVVEYVEQGHRRLKELQQTQ